jgi:bifunctional polynucleotide phosphatase/kinase
MEQFEYSRDLLFNPLLVIKHKNDPNENSDSILGFDFDWTLIRPKSKRVFPVDADDIMLCFGGILEKLNKEFKSGKRIVVFSNQSHKNFQMFKKRVFWFIKEMNYLPMTIIASLNKDLYRKPEIGMWEHIFGTQKLNIENCCYIGDAGGRFRQTKGGPKKIDFSCSDRKFAFNIGIKYKTPEVYFMEISENIEKWSWGPFNPFDYKEKKDKEGLAITFSHPEMIIMIGPPASGKSSFVKKFLKEYTRINNDTFKNKKKCLDKTLIALKGNENIVIDNTNPSVEVRADYIKLAKQFNYRIKCYILGNMELAKHLNVVRYRLSKDKSRLIPNIAYNIFYSKYQTPTEKEGFSEITQIPFNIEFESFEHKQAFYRYS